MSSRCRHARINVRALLILVSVCAILAVGLVTAHDVRRHSLARRARSSADAAWANQDWPEAARCLKQYLGTHPDDLGALERYAQAQLSVRPVVPERMAAAAAAYRRLLRHRPEDLGFARQLVRLYVRIGDFDQAVQSYDRLPDHADPECTLWWARAMVALQRAPQARDGLERLIQRHPDVVDAWLILSQIELQSESDPQRPLALHWLDEAFKHNPVAAQVLVRRGWFYRSVRGSASDARRELAQAEALSLENPGVRRELAEEWLSLGDLDRAAAHLEALERVDENTLETHDLDPAAFALSRQLLASRLTVARGDSAGGAEVADRALAELNGASRFLYLPTAVELYAGGDRPADARRCLDEYRELVRSNGAGAAALVEPLETLEALVLVAENKPYPAIDHLDDLVTRDRRNVQAWQLLAVACEKTNQRRRAARALEEYLIQRPRDADAALRLARMCAGMDWARTLKYATQLEFAEADSLEPTLLRIEAQLHLAGDSLTNAQTRSLLEELEALRRAYPTRTVADVLHARLLAGRGLLDESIVVLESSMDDADDPCFVSLELAGIYRELGRTARAIAMCDAAALHQPGLAAPRLAKAELQALQGCTDEARNTLESAANELIGSERSIAMSACARHWLAHGQASAARQVLEQLAAEQPTAVAPRLTLLALPEIESDASATQRLIDEIKSIEGLRGLRWQVEQCRAWLRGGEWKARADDIVQMLTRCIDAEPTWASPALTLGQLHELQGDLEKAEETYRSALGAMPLDVSLATSLLDLLERQRRYAAAAEILDRFAAAPSHFSGQRIRVALGRQDYPGAIEELQRRVNFDPNDAPSRVWLAKLLYGTRNDLRSASRLLDEAAAVSPGLPSILAARVSILHRAGRQDEARKLLDGVVEGRADYGAYRLRADYYAATDQAELAEADYRQLTAFPAQAAEGYAILGGFYEKLGKSEQALAAWQAGLKIAPQSIELRERLMTALLAKPDPESKALGRRMLDGLLEVRPNDPELLYALGTALLEDRTSPAGPQASEILERVVKIAPYHVNAHLKLIRMARDQGDRRRAGALAARALANNDKDPSVRLAAARVEAESGNITAAWEMARRVTQSDPQNIPARNLLVSLALNAGETKMARSLNDEVLCLDSDDATAQLARADILSRDGRRADAIQALEAYLRHAEEPRPLEHILYLAQLYRLDADLEKSALWIEEAARTAPKDPSVESSRLHWMAAAKEYDAMVIRLEGADATSLDPKIALAGASLLAASGENRYLHAARKVFGRVADSHPDEPEAHLGLAQVAYQLGDLEAARQAYERVLAIEPCHQQALNDLAWILGLELNQPRQGLELANKAILRYPDDPHLLDTRGVLLHMMDRIDEARKDLERSIELSEGVPQTGANARLHLGRLCVQEGDLMKARTNMLAAMELDQLHRIFSDHQRAEIHQVVLSP